MRAALSVVVWTPGLNEIRRGIARQLRDRGTTTSTPPNAAIDSVNRRWTSRSARHAIPHMLEQGSGYLLNVASAAGLLVIPDTVSYTVTKHAAIGFTEWPAVMHGDRGIGVSVLCPSAVRTPILEGKEDTPEGRDAITHRAARRHRHGRARREALYDLHACVGARQVRDQSA
jgi:NAD(P)-dependent dehydrogenase (short-subunit alcohol dehydrogenase family)